MPTCPDKAHPGGIIITHKNYKRITILYKSSLNMTSMIEVINSNPYQV
jgi:hypothetical protein